MPYEAAGKLKQHGGVGELWLRGKSKLSVSLHFGLH
jgi:hypothetical protein